MYKKKYRKEVVEVTSGIELAINYIEEGNTESALNVLDALKNEVEYISDVYDDEADGLKNEIENLGEIIYELKHR